MVDKTEKKQTINDLQNGKKRQTINDLQNTIQKTNE